MNEDMALFLRKVSGADQAEQGWADMGRQFALLYRSMFETLGDKTQTDAAYMWAVFAFLQVGKST